MKIVSATHVSQNRKTGPISVTHAPKQTCPPGCPLWAACYGSTQWPLNIQWNAMTGNAARHGPSPLELAHAEARAIDALPATGQPLRLHIVGDAGGGKPPDVVRGCAQVLAQAAQRFIRRGGGPVWTYTHQWRITTPQDWAPIQVFASCERRSQVHLALRRGFEPALISENPRPELDHGLRAFPCPADRGNTDCARCGWCYRKPERRRGRVLTFKVKGPGKGTRKVRALLDS